MSAALACIIFVGGSASFVVAIAVYVMDRMAKSRRGAVRS